SCRATARRQSRSSGRRSLAQYSTPPSGPRTTMGRSTPRVGAASSKGTPARRSVVRHASPPGRGRPGPIATGRAGSGAPPEEPAGGAERALGADEGGAGAAEVLAALGRAGSSPAGGGQPYPGVSQWALAGHGSSEPWGGRHPVASRATLSAAIARSRIRETPAPMTPAPKARAPKARAPKPRAPRSPRSRAPDARALGPRALGSRSPTSRGADPRTAKSRTAESRTAETGETRRATPRVLRRRRPLRKAAAMAGTCADEPTRGKKTSASVRLEPGGAGELTDELRGVAPRGEHEAQDQEPRRRFFHLELLGV